MIVHQAERAIVLEDLPVLPAISRGWDIFRSNLGPIILMAIILGVIGFGGGIYHCHSSLVLWSSLLQFAVCMRRAMHKTIHL